MDKKILGSVFVFFIIVTILWFSQPAIVITTPKDEITVSQGDRITFKVKVREGRCPQSTFLLYEFCERINLLPINYVSFVDEKYLTYDPTFGWSDDTPHQPYYPSGNQNESIKISFDKPGTYKIVAAGIHRLLINGSEIVARSVPVTVHVISPVK